MGAADLCTDCSEMSGFPAAPHPLYRGHRDEVPVIFRSSWSFDALFTCNPYPLDLYEDRVLKKRNVQYSMLNLITVLH